MSDTGENSQVVVSDSDDFIARLIAPGAMFLVVLSIWTIIRMFWKDVDDRRIWLLTGSIISVIILMVSPMVIQGKGIHPIIKGLVALLLFVPFVLGCYLVFYEGLWRLRFIENGFSFGIIAATIIYVVGGFGVVKATYNVSEFARSISAGTIRFD